MDSSFKNSLSLPSHSAQTVPKEKKTSQSVGGGTSDDSLGRSCVLLALHPEERGGLRGLYHVAILKYGFLRSSTFPDVKPDWSTVALMWMS